MSANRSTSTVDEFDPAGTGGPTLAGDDAERASPDEVELLIAATWAVTARAGSIEPSVREILEQAGLSTKAFYRHFRSKDELLLVSLDEGTRVLVEYLERRMAGADDPLKAVDAWIEGFVRQAVSPLGAARTKPWTLGIGRLATTYPAAFDQNQAAIVAPLERAIRDAMAQGSARTPDPGRDARLMYAYTSDTVRHHLVRGTVPDGATTRHLTDFARRAIGAG